MRSTRRSTINQHPLPGKNHHHQNSAETQTGEGCIPPSCQARPGGFGTTAFRPQQAQRTLHRKLKIVPSPTCPCGEEDQTTEHVLQRCNRHQPERIAQWPLATPLHRKLYRLLDNRVVECSLRGVGGPGFNPQSRTASYQRRYKNGTSSSLV